MKITLSVLLASVVVFSSAAHAGDKCYQAKDTSKMSARIYDEKTNKVSKSKVVRASLRLSSQTESFGELKTAELKLKTNSGIRATIGAFYHEESRTYGVECDGGGMRLLRDADGNVTVKADYIRADIDGCDRTLDLVTPGTKFTRVSCQ